MGTRADFYIGRGTDAEWLGSIAWDGYPTGITPKNERWPSGALFAATNEFEFVDRLETFFEGRLDVTRPEQGWPWPWPNSQTTDYAYAYDAGHVWASNYGREWFDPVQPGPEVGGDKTAVFPNMEDRQNVAFGPRSGVIVIGG